MGALSIIIVVITDHFINYLSIEIWLWITKENRLPCSRRKFSEGDTCTVSMQGSLRIRVQPFRAVSRRTCLHVYSASRSTGVRTDEERKVLKVSYAASLIFKFQILLLSSYKICKHTRVVQSAIEHPYWSRRCALSAISRARRFSDLQTQTS